MKMTWEITNIKDGLIGTTCRSPLYVCKKNYFFDVVSGYKGDTNCYDSIRLVAL